MEVDKAEDVEKVGYVEKLSLRSGVIVKHCLIAIFLGHVGARWPSVPRRCYI
jgi:hypothetical protein